MFRNNGYTVTLIQRAFIQKLIAWCDKTDSQGLTELYYQVGSHLSLEGNVFNKRDVSRTHET